MNAISGISTVNEKGMNIGRAVASFADDNGDQLVALTVAQSAVEAFAAQQIDRREFLRRVDADLSGLLDVDRLESLTRRTQGIEREAEISLAAELAVEWAVEKNLITTSCEPPYDGKECDVSINAPEVLRHRASQNELLGFGLGLAGAGTMDEEASSALKAAKVVSKIAKAESLADEGLKEKNLSKIDEAIALRPKDWAVRDRRAALLVAEGNASGARQALDESDRLVKEQIDAGGDCQTLQLNLLRNRRAAFGRASEENPGSRELRERLDATNNEIQAVEGGLEGSPCT